MNAFKVNGKEYTAKAFDFNLVCDLEEMGISLEEMSKRKMSMIRSYFALCAGEGNEFAGSELEAHFVDGGKLEDIILAMNKEMEKSGFFQALRKTAETETGESQTEEAKKA